MEKGKNSKSIPDNFDKNRSNFKVTEEISVRSSTDNPEDCEELVNCYGTYNIQPTADSHNDFPAIAQGTPDYMKKRPLKFFRDGDSPNPAKDHTDADAFPGTE